MNILYSILYMLCTIYILFIIYIYIYYVYIVEYNICFVLHVTYYVFYVFIIYVFTVVYMTCSDYFYQRKFHGGNSELPTFACSLAQRSLCPVGMCLKRSWRHILTSPKEIMKSHSHQPKDHCVQLACALRDHEVTFSLAQRSLCPRVSSWHVP